VRQVAVSLLLVVIGFNWEELLAKIAVEFDSALTSFGPCGGPNHLLRWSLARGKGWSVSDVKCNAGRHVRPVQEQHSSVCIAIVTSGSFQYRSSPGCELMTPGSLMLGNAGQYFECAHDHGVGDRCISFSYEPQFFENLVIEAGARAGAARFSSLRVPPVRELSNVVSRACAASAQFNLQGTPNRDRMVVWEEIAFELGTRALQFANQVSKRGSSPAAESRVTRIVRMIEDHPTAGNELPTLAQEAKLSRYHFLRLFRQFTGLTPHQYVRRARLRHAATRLLLEPARILDIALDCGFADVSNFNHAFRAEFGISPRGYRATESLMQIDPDIAAEIKKRDSPR
jgi:AraC family transcriptional regulator